MTTTQHNTREETRNLATSFNVNLFSTFDLSSSRLLEKKLVKMLSQRKQDLLKIWNKTIKNYPLLSLSLSLISDLLRFWTRISLQGCHYSKVVFFIYHLRKRQDWPFWVCMQAKTKTILWRTKQVSDFYYLRLIKGKQSHKEREKKILNCSS